MRNTLELISSAYLEQYVAQADADWPKVVAELKAKERFSVEDFEHYLIASSLYSSKIEGNTLDVNSFFRNRDKPSAPKRKEVQEIEDLVEAYRFASSNTFSQPNFLEAHAILSGSFLPKKEQGKIRVEQVGIRDSATMKPVYLAVEPEFASTELDKLFKDVDYLLSSDLTTPEVFYHAAMLHLWLAKIHPFMDGNGRIARLAEKWFLASKLGIGAWSINSEKYYWDHRQTYYDNISLGYNYYALHWERCVPFLLMLPSALNR